MKLDIALKNKIIAAIVQYNNINQQLNKYELEARFDDYFEDIETNIPKQILLDGYFVSAEYITIADKYVRERYNESLTTEKLNNISYDVAKIDTIVLLVCENGNLIWANRRATFYMDSQNSCENDTSFYKDEKFSTVELGKMPEYKM